MRTLFLYKQDEKGGDYCEVWIINGTEPPQRLPLTVYKDTTKKWSIWGTPNWKMMKPIKVTAGNTTTHKDYFRFVKTGSKRKMFDYVKKLIEWYLGNTWRK